MHQTRHIVKRKGHIEEYDERKVYASAYASALNCHYEDQDAEILAEKVMTKVNKWMHDKKSIYSTQIRAEILKEMESIDPDVALMYKHHLDLS